MKIKAAIFEEVNKPMVIDEVELEGPKEREVLIDLKASGVCHTDMYTWCGDDPSGYWPAVLGHEGAGVVVEVGKGVDHIEVGDHVVPFFKPHCGACPDCLGPSNHCQMNNAFQGSGVMADQTTRIKRGSESIKHYMGCSTFAEACVCHVNNVAVVPKDVDLKKVGLLGCGITTGVGAAIWSAQVVPGSTCAVFGCGGVGMSIIQGCRLAGAHKIIAVDLSDDRLEKSKTFGATDTVKGDDNPIEHIRDLVGARGVDFVFEATGITDVMTTALEVTRSGTGTCCICGVAGKGDFMKVVPRNLITGKKLIGSSFGGAKGRIHIPQLVQWYKDGRLQIDELATAEMKLEQVNEAFEMMERQEGFRSILVYD